jgi:hypothetical protein
MAANANNKALPLIFASKDIPVPPKIKAIIKKMPTRKKSRPIKVLIIFKI